MPSQAERAGTDRKEAMTVPTPTPATGKRCAVALKEALRDAKATLRRPEKALGDRRPRSAHARLARKRGRVNVDEGSPLAMTRFAAAF